MEYNLEYMRYLRIGKRKLREAETGWLVKEIRKYPDITYISPYQWRNFRVIYAAESGKKLAGVCALMFFSDWVKIGPIVVFEQFQGKGIGKKLINKAIEEYKNNNILIASSNKKVKKILGNYHFLKTGILKLPWEIKIFGIKYLIENLNFIFLKEVFRKKFVFKRDKFICFIKTN